MTHHVATAVAFAALYLAAQLAALYLVAGTLAGGSFGLP